MSRNEDSFSSLEHSAESPPKSQYNSETCSVHTPGSIFYHSFEALGAMKFYSMIIKGQVNL